MVPTAPHFPAQAGRLCHQIFHNFMQAGFGKIGREEELQGVAGAACSGPGGAPHTFTFQAENPGRNFAVAGANVTLWFRKDLQVRIDYNAEVGRRNYSAHYLNAGLRYEF